MRGLGVSFVVVALLTACSGASSDDTESGAGAIAASDGGPSLPVPVDGDYVLAGDATREGKLVVREAEGASFLFALTMENKTGEKNRLELSGDLEVLIEDGEWLWDRKHPADPCGAKFVIESPTRIAITQVGACPRFTSLGITLTGSYERKK